MTDDEKLELLLLATETVKSREESEEKDSESTNNDLLFASI